MTTKKHLKHRVRALVAETGQPYTSALRVIRSKHKESAMSGITTPAGKIIASCSFCGKTHHQVTRIVAGPGVYICNECVALSAAVIADAAETTPEESRSQRDQYFHRPPDQILALLPALIRSSARIEAELSAWIARLRELGTDWAVIARALGFSIEATRQRFETASHPEPNASPGTGS
jgi:hypothetical protein